MFQINRGFKDPRFLRRFGNKTTTATSDVLVSARTYNEPASQAQRSVKSTSASDGSAKTVRIVYLNSAYQLAFEDKILNGTTAVPTTATDIRFIEDYYLVKGAAAVGAIELFPNNDGTGTAICGIGAGTTQAFLCHHYVPDGKEAWALGWGATTTREVNLKLLGQDRIDGTNLVDRVLDLENIRLGFVLGTETDRHTDFSRALGGIYMPEQTYWRINVVPEATTSTVTRAWMHFWEDNQ